MVLFGAMSKVRLNGSNSLRNNPPQNKKGAIKTRRHKKPKDWDGLAKDALAATRLGMHYGDYIAKYKPPRETAPVKNNGRVKICAHCGKPFHCLKANQMYCSEFCRQAEKTDRKKARKVAKKEEANAE